MSSESGAEMVERVVRADGRFPIDAYQFLQRGLEYAASHEHGERTESKSRHVTGQQLCEALSALAVKLWGPLASEVLRQWNITSTRDFGEMVFLLVRHELMGRRDSDSIEDFDDVYDFGQVFSAYEVPSRPAEDDEALA